MPTLKDVGDFLVGVVMLAAFIALIASVTLTVLLAFSGCTIQKGIVMYETNTYPAPMCTP